MYNPIPNVYYPLSPGVTLSGTEWSVRVSFPLSGQIGISVLKRLGKEERTAAIPFVLLILPAPRHPEGARRATVRGKLRPALMPDGTFAVGRLIFDRRMHGVPPCLQVLTPPLAPPRGRGAMEGWFRFRMESTLRRLPPWRHPCTLRVRHPEEGPWARREGLISAIEHGFFLTMEMRCPRRFCSKTSSA